MMLSRARDATMNKALSKIVKWMETEVNLLDFTMTIVALRQKTLARFS